MVRGPSEVGKLKPPLKDVEIPCYEFHLWNSFLYNLPNRAFFGGVMVACPANAGFLHSGSWHQKKELVYHEACARRPSLTRLKSSHLSQSERAGSYLFI